MAGMGRTSAYEMRKANPGWNQPDYSQGNAYAQSIPQQAEDYSTIMGGYKGLMEGGGGYDPLISQYSKMVTGPEGKFNPAVYTQAPEWGESYGMLKGLAETGGLNATEQGDLRARGISPIRAVYANAQRGLDRNKALSGGYSANYGAASAKMARELSESVAGATTNVNAEIAKMVQEGKLKATPELANMAAGKNELMNKIGMANSENEMKANQNKTANMTGWSNALSGKAGNSLDALKGMTNLYGTTPALVNTFGNQVQNSQQMAMTAAQQRQQNKNATLASLMRGRG